MPAGSFSSGPGHPGLTGPGQPQPRPAGHGQTGPAGPGQTGPAGSGQPPLAGPGRAPLAVPGRPRLAPEGGRADYVELRCRSAFSFLDGASLPEDLVARAVELGYDALALADRDGVYGAPRFFGAAKNTAKNAANNAANDTTKNAAKNTAAGGALRPVVGAEVTLAGAPPLLLLVEDRTGYQNLCRLLTAARAGRGKADGAAAGYALLEEHAAGLVALAGAAPRDDLDRLLAIYGRRRSLYLELQRHLDDDEARVVRAVEAQAAAHRIPLVATNDVRYAAAARRRVHDVLTCARLKTRIDDAGRGLPRNAERCLKAPAVMAALFRDRPDAVRASRAIAERCAFTLGDLGYQFPRYPTLGGESEHAFLERLTWEGARRRYRPLHEKARRQIAHELAVIGKLELAGYFLVVWDVVRYAQERGIMVQGRGSAANSATCYALGITAVDPVGMDLLFERFLSEERVRGASSVADRMPDIDLDLPSGERREEVIQHVYRKYGARGAAMTANVITYRPRMAVRDAGRALGFAEDQLDRIAKLLPGWIGGDDDKPIAAFLADAGFDPGEPRTRLLAEIATDLLNLPRHIGQHSGGMIVAAGRLDDVVPLEPASMPGRVVVQWDKDDCADMGIVKVDLLGLGMLAVLEEAQRLVRASEGLDVDYAHLPPDDAKSYRMMRAADTVGVFQIESRAQMATLPRMKPERFYDLVVEVAIIRPGPIVGQMVNPYLERRAGRQEVSYPHPSLEPILARTLGVPLFQEQLIRMAMAAAGFTGGQAEELRRAMGFKRSAERMKAIEADLRAGMTARGITGAAQEEIVRGIKSFALYGFPESHAASFALIAYASAFLKAHHHAAFTCALLNNWPMGFYHPSTLVTDAARHDVEVRPIDVTVSGWLCSLETRGSVRLGLRYVAGLREEVGRRIGAARPYTSLADFHARAQPNEAEMVTLAEIGALGALGGTRRQALWQAEALGRNGALFARGPSAAAVPRPESERDDDARRGEMTPGAGRDDARQGDARLDEMTPGEEVAAEILGTGINTGPHPLSFMRRELAARGVRTAAELSRVRDGQRACVAGVVVVRQRPGTAKGFVFVTLEDETGFANAILTPATFEAWRRVILGAGALLIEGVVQSRDGTILLRADRFERLRGRATDADVSRDFR